MEMNIMKRLMVLLIVVGIFTTACSNNKDIKYGKTYEIDLASELLDDVHSEKIDNGIVAMAMDLPEPLSTLLVPLM